MTTLPIIHYAHTIVTTPPDEVRVVVADLANSPQYRTRMQRMITRFHDQVGRMALAMQLDPKAVTAAFIMQIASDLLAGEDAALVAGAPGDVIGKTIQELRPLSPAELEANGWQPARYQIPVALVLSDGTVLYASQDEEGNGPGALFGTAPNGDMFTLGVREGEA